MRFFPSIPFDKIYRFFFKTFDISRDTRLIQDLRKRRFKHAMIVKRSYIFGLFISWILVLTAMLTALNVFNAHSIYGESVEGIAIISALSFSLVSLLYASITYLAKFVKTYGRTNEIMGLDELETELVVGDVNFTRFFNQIGFNIVVFYAIIAFNVINMFVVKPGEGFAAFAFGTFDIMCLVAQIFAMHYYRKRMIDLEMDFNLVMPGKIYFINQRNMMTDQQTLDSNKIKTIKDSTTTWFSAFFNLGNISVLTEGDQGALGIMEMFYVDDPKNTVKNMEALVKEKHVVIESEYLAKIVKHLGIKEEEFDTSESKSKIREFLKGNDASVKEDYQKGDVIKKQEIEDMYEWVSKN